ncbi:MAG: TIGR02710 family CRISPR-associated CARF protein [Syntrophorhabdales bacterium]|jgi:CRISPR-associated protein (TIGR02710 family)
MADAMIVSVGGTPAPIVKSIGHFKPKFVVFFASQDTADQVTAIKSETGRNGVTFRSEMTLVDDVNDLLTCNDKAEEAVRRVSVKGHHKDDVIVDYTGGTKNMSVALALAAITHGFSFSYVGGDERTKSGTGTVIDGQERVYQSVNPWDLLGIEEKKKIGLLFNQCQYKAAKELADSLANRSTRHRTLFRKVGFLVEGYYLWDLFRHKQALERFGKARIDEIIEGEDRGARKFAQETQHSVAFLENLTKEISKPSRLLLLDLYSNAERRIREGKIDDAIFRLYRLVEMMAQEALLVRHAIDTSNVEITRLPHAIRQAIVDKYKNPRDGKVKIPQAAAFELLAALNDPLGCTFAENIHRFLNVQQARNYSYLAHGFGSSKESTYKDLRDFVLGLGTLEGADAPMFPEMAL